MPRALVPEVLPPVNESARRMHEVYQAAVMQNIQSVFAELNAALREGRQVEINISNVAKVNEAYARCS